MVKQRDWDQEYDSGRWDFLGQADQQLRHNVIAGWIAQLVPGYVVDLGCGSGHLLNWIRPGTVTRYTGVDLSASAMSAMPSTPFQVDRIVSDIAAFTPEPVAASAIVASEVLYFLEDAGAELDRIVGACESVQAVIVCLVLPRDDKPNWLRSTSRVWSSLAAQGWQERQIITMQDQVSGNGWRAVLY